MAGLEAWLLYLKAQQSWVGYLTSLCLGSSSVNTRIIIALASLGQLRGLRKMVIDWGWGTQQVTHKALPGPNSVYGTYLVQDLWNLNALAI